MAYWIVKTKDPHISEHLAARHLAKNKTVPKANGVEAGAIPPSKESENEAEYLVKEDLSDLKNTWQKMHGTKKPK